MPMAETLVHGCDWCGVIVPSKGGKGQFASHVTIADKGSPPHPEPKEQDICADCRKALKALQEGRYRRAG